MSEIEKLKLENKILKRKLEIASIWMKKEIKSQIKDVDKLNIDKKINKKINNFFWDIILLNIPKTVINNIISAEISYYNLKENKNWDWLSVIISYHKALDTIIESFITKWFRKFAKKDKNLYLKENDLLEKSLRNVINSWYILSIWRLFHILKLIKTWEKLLDYQKCFNDYLNKYKYLKDILIEDNFYNNLEIIINSEVLWSKRHTWNISFEETKKARNILIWKLENKNCIIYKLIESQSVEF